MDNAEELKKLKVAELKEKLQALGLPVAGKKDELVARLLEHHDAAHASAGASPKKSSSPSASPKKSAAAVVTSASEDDLADLAPPAEEPKWLAE